MSENKPKHVPNEIPSEIFELPTNNQVVARVVKVKGDLKKFYKVATSCGITYLASMARKFRNKEYVLDGHYVLIEAKNKFAIAEGKPLEVEIVQILNKATIEFYKQNDEWPAPFDKSSGVTVVNITESDSSESDSDDDIGLFS